MSCFFVPFVCEAAAFLNNKLALGYYGILSQPYLAEVHHLEKFEIT